MAYQFHYTPTGTGVISGKEVLEQTEDAINDLSGQISGDVQIAIDTANNALNTANTASADAQNAVNTASTAYTAATNAQNTANTAQNTASNALTAAQNAQNDVNALGNRVTTAEGNITQNTNAITGLTTRMGTAEGNITTLQNDVITAQATATSAQQTATTARQQSYVFRYSSTALTASSTNSNALLDNTDNLKVGDKVIDSSGVLFSITAIDTQNSTFTIGTALIDLAQDSDVVHKSGNESIAGVKSFSNDTYIKSLNFTNEVPSQSSSNSSVMPIITTITYGDSSPLVQARLNLRITADGIKSLYPHENNQYSLGLTSRKWSEVHGVTYYYGSSDTEFSTKFVTTDTDQAISGNKTFSSINGVVPGSLSMPNFNNRIDISSYVTNLNGTYNAYTPSVDGWIAIQSSNATFIRIADTGSGGLGNTVTSQTAGTLTCMIPVRANRQNNIYIVCTTLTSAYFIPCQGNV